MPIIKSAAKRMRQDRERYRRNLHVKRQMRAAAKAVTDSITAGNEKQARDAQQTAQKTIDKAVKKGVIHKNTAARKKSQLARQLKERFGAEKTTAPKQQSTKSTAKKAPATKKTTATKQSGSKTTSASTKSKPAAKKSSSPTKK